MSFYTFDHYFETWWTNPEMYVGRMINSGVKYSLTPNYSQYMPRVEGLNSLYRSRWVGRYMQEAGIKIIPDVTWIDGDIEYLEKYSAATLPVGLPMIALQLHTIDPKEVEGGIEHFEKQVAKVFEVLQPQGALIYANNPGKELMDKINPDCKIRIIETRNVALGLQAKNRTKKTTI